MCYGDIDHGNDGYYRVWAESQNQEEQEQEEIEADAAPTQYSSDLPF